LPRLRGNLALTGYKVIIELSAQRDLQGILRYITDTLKEPVFARRIYTSIKEQILTLDQMPLRHSIVRDQPYTEMGVRILLVENYIAFYIIDDKSAKSMSCVSSITAESGRIFYKRSYIDGWPSGTIASVFFFLYSLGGIWTCFLKNLEK